MRAYPERFDPTTGNQYDTPAQAGTREAQERRERRRAWDALNGISGSVYAAARVDVGILGSMGPEELEAHYEALEFKGVNDYSVIDQKPVRDAENYVSAVKQRLKRSPHTKTALWAAFEEIDALKVRMAAVEAK